MAVENLQAPGKRTIYSDVDLTFPIHPLKNDIIPLTNEDAVRQAVLLLVMTNYYEAPYEPFKGGNLKAQLFELADGLTALALRDGIVRVLNRHEPRIKDLEVLVADNIDNNEYIVRLQFTIISIGVRTELEFNLQRLR